MVLCNLTIDMNQKSVRICVTCSGGMTGVACINVTTTALLCRHCYLFVQANSQVAKLHTQLVIRVLSVIGKIR